METSQPKITLKKDRIEDPPAPSSKKDNTIKSFIKDLDIKVLSSTEDKLVFDIKGIEPPLANALRRIMISEVPTMAIEKVRIWQNLSVIADEVLAHRMGLIPIKADPAEFEFKDPHEPYNEKNSLKY